MSQQSLDAPEVELHPIDILRDILAQAGTLSRLMEIHYLVQEPGLLDIMRYVAGLSDGDRAKLLRFLGAHESPSRLRVHEVGSGMLHLEYERNPPLQWTA